MPAKPNAVPTCRCLLCGHVWVPRSGDELPKRCPPPLGCGSPNWFRGRTYKIRAKGDGAMDQDRTMNQDPQVSSPETKDQDQTKDQDHG